MQEKTLKYVTFPCVVNGWNKPDPDIQSFSPEGVMLRWILLGLLQERPTNGWVSGQLQPSKIAFHLGLGFVFRLALKLGWEGQFS